MVISYNHVDSTYTVTAAGFSIETTVTAYSAVVSSWIDDTLRINQHNLDNLLIGFGVMRRPRELGGSGVNPAALLQLCVDCRCLVFQLLYCPNIPDKLTEFLSDNRFCLVGVKIEDDLEELGNEHGLLVGCQVKDLRELAFEKVGAPHLRLPELPNLVHEFMSALWLYHMVDTTMVQDSPWTRLVLAPEQIEYATVLAFATYEIARQMYAIVRSRRM